MPTHGKSRIRDTSQSEIWSSCLPTVHGRSRIREVRLINHSPMLTTFRQIETMGVLEDEMLVAKEKEIEGRRIPYFPQGEMLTKN